MVDAAMRESVGGRKIVAGDAALHSGEKHAVKMKMGDNRYSHIAFLELGLEL